MLTEELALRRAVKMAGNASQLAKKTGMSPQRIHYMLHTSKKASTHAAVLIERALGIPAHELRPDMFAPPAKPNKRKRA